MAAFRLAAKAKTDLKSIGSYAERTWGREQRNKYLARLDSTFHTLAYAPYKGRACDDIREGYRKYRVGKHIVFYRQTGDSIEVIRVLHERMDLTSQL